jgi:hypothetical protein
MTDGQLYFLAAAIFAATTLRREVRIFAAIFLFVLCLLSGGTDEPERTQRVVERPAMST